uniref:Uncharacterized protein n=1 Tax=Ditylenchus dipsaci TaxID=166011 RepID=A0A915DJF2_9BILA
MNKSSAKNPKIAWFPDVYINNKPNCLEDFNKMLMLQMKNAKIYVDVPEKKRKRRKPPISTAIKQRRVNRLLMKNNMQSLLLLLFLVKLFHVFAC